MKVYFAGGDNERFFNLLAEQGIRNILWSFYYLFYEQDIKNFRRFFGKYNPKDFNVFLDCGAYTAWTLGKKINIDQYINFIKANQDIFTVYSSLDDKNSFENTRDNLIYMEKAGLKPLPVYHLGESWDYFKEISSKHNYVAIGGIAGNKKLTQGEILRELNHAISIAKEFKTKIHFYGFTSYQGLAKSPVYSCDSTSWLNGGKMGTVFVPNHNKRQILPYHYKDKELFRYKDYIEKCGVRYEDLAKSEGYIARDIVNIRTYLEMEIELTKLYEEQSLRYWEDPEVSSKSPKVSKPPITSATGRIQEIMQNPEARKKWLEKVKGNLFAFKTGKYATVPYYCNDCYVKGKCSLYQEPKEAGDKVLCALHKDFKTWFSPEDFDYREEDTVNEARNRVMNVLLSRAGFNLWTEILDGGIQDKALTSLLFGIYDRLANRPQFQLTKIDVNLEFAEAVNNLDEESRNKIIAILREIISKERGEPECEEGVMVDRE